MKIDLTILMYWVVPAFIGFLFGAISSLLAYRYQRKRDDITWKREKEKMQNEFSIDLTRLREEIKQDLYKQREISVRTEILPTIWNNLLNAQGKIGIITAVFRQFPDLNHWPDEQIEEFLKKSVLNDFHKQQLRHESDKITYYQKIIFWYELNDAQQAFHQFHNHVLHNKIFVDGDLYAKLAEIDKCFSEMLIALEVHHEGPLDSRQDRQELYKAIRDHNMQVDTLRTRIEQLI